MEELCKAGEVLCRYEVEKKDAIAREDYDTASAKKVRCHTGSSVLVVEVPLSGFLVTQTLIPRLSVHSIGCAQLHKWHSNDSCTI